MLIMPATDFNFQRMADLVASDFFSNDVPLLDGVVKVAREKSLTPEEIRRLVEKTNTAASMRMLKSAVDKKASFALASTTDVLLHTHPVVSSEPGSEKTASVYTGLPVRKQEAPAVAAPLQKVASEEKLAADCVGLPTVFALQRELDARKLQKTSTDLSVQDRIDYLSSEFNTWRGPDFTKFASECLAVFGQPCLPVVRGLAAYLHEDLGHIEKMAKDISDVVDDTTPHMTAMHEICSGLRESIKLAEEIAELEQALDWCMAELKSRAGKC